MLTMEQIHDIRKKYFDEGLSIRQIAKQTGYDRSTIKKYVSQEDFSPQVPMKPRRRGKTEPYRAQARLWLEMDEEAPRRQRHTAKRIYQRLKEESEAKGLPFDVSERSIRSMVAELRTELAQIALTALPLLHPPGEAQVDFGRTDFYLQGIKIQGYHLGITFPHSDAKYVQLFKGQNFECLAQGLTDFFQHLGGTPTAIWFDNMSTAVKKIKSHGERDITDNFRRLQCHYGFDSNFCNPAAGHEKGSVENFIGYSRRNYFVPIPKIDNLEAYNQELLDLCDKDLDREHYKYKRSVSSLFESDRQNLKPLPLYPFEACSYVPARTNNYGKIRYQRNTYSSSGNLRSCQVTLKLGAHQVTVLDGRMKPVVTHPRLYGKDQESMLWGPYLEILAQRPAALKYSEFYTCLPDPLRLFMDACPSEDKRQILKLLSKNDHTNSLEESIAHLAEAVKLDPDDADSLIAAYHFLLNRPGPIPKNKLPDHIQPTPEYELDLSVYKQLMGGMVCQGK